MIFEKTMRKSKISEMRRFRIFNSRTPGNDKQESREFLVAISEPPPERFEQEKEVYFLNPGCEYICKYKHPSSNSAMGEYMIYKGIVLDPPEITKTCCPVGWKSWGERIEEFHRTIMETKPDMVLS